MSGIPPPTLLLGAAARQGAAAAREALAAAREDVLSLRHGSDGLSVARGLAAVLDGLVRARLDATPGAPAAAVLAVGGYGRGDLSPFSDLDLLVVAARRTPAVKESAAALARFLWDAGAEVNLTVRTPRGARRAMERDHATASSFLDRRFVGGDEGERDRFEAEALRPFLHERGPRLAEEKRAEARRRRAALGNTAAGLEPDVKDSPGGLRDVHLLRWLHLAGGGDPAAGLLPGLPRAAAAPLVAAYGTLLRYRCALHLLAGRRQDLLDLSTQRDLVPLLAPADRGGDTDGPAEEDPVPRHIEAMTPWFAAARTVGLACERALRDGDAPAAPLPSTPAELLALLAAPGDAGPILRALHETDGLARLLPEFAEVTALPQADPYHAFTVDEHTLRALEALDDAVAGRGPAGERFRAEAALLPSLRPLRLALLLHDVGKTRGPRDHARRGAERAGEAALRLGLPAEEVRAVRRLVAHHTVLGEASAVASAADPGPPRAVAAQAGGVEGLRLLLLHTAADIGGVGRGAWSRWRAAQLLHFHDRAAAAAAGEEVRPEDLRRGILAALPRGIRSAGRRLLDAAPERYLAAADPVRARAHLRLLRALRRGAPAAVRVEPPRDGAAEVAVAAPDRPHLFADLAGTLTLHGLDVLTAEAYTLGDSTALDVFSVALPLRGRARLRAALGRAAASPGSVEPAVARYVRRVPAGRRPAPDGRVLVRRDDDGTGPSAILRVECPDRPGLLHDLARALSREGCDLLEVRVATLGPRALDVFRVAGGSGDTRGVLDRLRAAASRLEAQPTALPGLDAPQGASG